MTVGGRRSASSFLRRNLDVTGDGLADIVSLGVGDACAFCVRVDAGNREREIVTDGRCQCLVGLESVGDPLDFIREVSVRGMGDLDGDGRCDLMLTRGGAQPGQSTPWAIVLMGEQGPMTLPVDWGSSLRGLAAVGDLDADGADDVQMLVAGPHGTLESIVRSWPERRPRTTAGIAVRSPRTTDWGYWLLGSIGSSTLLLRSRDSSTLDIASLRREMVWETHDLPFSVRLPRAVHVLDGRRIDLDGDASPDLLTHVGSESGFASLAFLSHAVGDHAAS